MKEHKETIVFYLVSLFGNLLPLLVGLVYYAANMHLWAGWKNFYGDGQFYLYSASLLTSSAYIFYTYKVQNTDKNSIFLLITCLILFFVSFLYTLRLLNSNNDMVFVRNSSIVVFFITLVTYYYSNLLNNQKIDVVAAQKKGVQDILDQL